MSSWEHHHWYTRTIKMVNWWQLFNTIYGACGYNFEPPFLSMIIVFLVSMYVNQHFVCKEFIWFQTTFLRTSEPANPEPNNIKQHIQVDNICNYVYIYIYIAGLLLHTQLALTLGA